MKRWAMLAVVLAACGGGGGGDSELVEITNSFDVCPERIDVGYIEPGEYALGWYCTGQHEWFSDEMFLRSCERDLNVLADETRMVVTYDERNIKLAFGDMSIDGVYNPDETYTIRSELAFGTMSGVSRCGDGRLFVGMSWHSGDPSGDDPFDSAAWFVLATHL